jgi:hypothetical protein
MSINTNRLFRQITPLQLYDMEKCLIPIGCQCKINLHRQNLSIKLKQFTNMVIFLIYNFTRKIMSLNYVYVDDRKHIYKREFN